jgi:hypothetical protein
MMQIFACAGLVAVGIALALFVPRRAGFDPALRRVIVIVYAARTSAALVIFAVSLLPAMQSSQRVIGPGIWAALPDTGAYHASGTAQAEAKQLGITLTMHDGYSALVGFLYSNIAQSPLVVILCNSVADMLTLVMLLVLCRRAQGPAHLPWLAWVIGFWPSWLGWSTQLLKDSILFTLSTAMIFVAASVLYRAWCARGTPRYGFAEWPILGATAIVAGLFRQALVDVLTTAVAAVSLWFFVRAIRRPAYLRSAATAALLVVVILLSHGVLRSWIYPVTVEDTIRGYAELRAVKMQKAAAARSQIEGAPADAQPVSPTAYSAPAVAPARVPQVSAGESIMEGLRQYTTRLSLKSLSNLRDANLLGGTQFGAAGASSTAVGTALLLPVGLAHALFGPFPWTLSASNGSTGALRYVAVVEWPWLVALVVGGAAGAVRRWRMIVQRPDLTLSLVYGVLGVIALAVAVPNDGLLFRYRLPFLAHFAVFLPFAFEWPVIRKLAPTR